MMTKRNSEDDEKRSKALKNKPPTSNINVNVNDDDISIQFDIENEFHWARAAWCLINICKRKGQMENLNRILNKTEAEIKSGSLDIPDNK